jgi:hypothetical protein
VPSAAGPRESRWTTNVMPSAPMPSGSLMPAGPEPPICSAKFVLKE